MNINKKNKIIIIISAAIVALFIGFLLLTKDSESNLSPEITRAIKEMKNTIITKHQYVDGRHTFLGKFLVPNACYNYKLKVTDVGTDKIIEINYIQPEIEDCPRKEKTTKSFISSFESPEDQPIKFVVNGEPADLNIVEVPPGQDIKTFETAK